MEQGRAAKTLFASLHLLGYETSWDSREKITAGLHGSPIVGHTPIARLGPCGGRPGHRINVPVVVERSRLAELKCKIVAVVATATPSFCIYVNRSHTGFVLSVILPVARFRSARLLLVSVNDWSIRQTSAA